MCLYLGGSSQHVASLYTGMLLLELIPGATRPSTDINNNNHSVNNKPVKRLALVAMLPPALDVGPHAGWNYGIVTPYL